MLHIKRFMCLTLSTAMVLSGFAGPKTVQAGKAEHDADMSCLDELTSNYIKSTGEDVKYSDLLEGDFEIPEFAANDDSQIMNKKILTTPTDKLFTYKMFFKDASYGNGTLTAIKTPAKGSTISEAWAEMLCLAMKDDTQKNGDSPAISGAYHTALSYGSNPIAAYENAVLNDPYLTDKGVTYYETQIENAQNTNQAYARAAVMWGKDNSIYNDIKQKYKLKDGEQQTPCYCMVVVNNINSLKEKLKRDVKILNEVNGEVVRYSNGYFNKKPYVYVLFFHDFNAIDRQEDYFTTSAESDDVKKGDTPDVLKQKGIECSSKDVKSSVTYNNNDSDTSADMYYAENLTGSTSSVSTSYTVEEGIAKSVTQECSYSKACTNELSATQSFNYSIKATSPVVEVGMEMGFSATEMASWTVESSKMEGTTTDNSKVVTRTKDYSLEMPPYTRSTIVVQPTETTMTYTYDSKVSPVYKTDVLLYDPYIEVENGMIYSEKKNIKKYTLQPNCLNGGYYRNVTIDELFKTAVVNYAHNNIEPSTEKSWMKYFVASKSSQASLSLGNLYFCRPTLPCGGKFSMTKKGVRITASEFEPVRNLQVIKPSINQIDLSEGETYDLSEVSVSGFNDMGALFYGFDENTSGEWAVESGPAVISKNTAGHYELKATGAGTAIIKYAPTHVNPAKLSQTIDIKGITVNITGAAGDATTGSKDGSANGETIETSHAEYEIVGDNVVVFSELTNEKATSVNIPATIKSAGKTYKVTGISEGALENCKKLKKVSIGSNVEEIGEDAFAGCKALTEITIPSSVTSIGEKAFYNCKKLKNITIKTDKLTKKTVGSNAFKGINSKAVIKVPSKVYSSYKKILKKKGVTKKSQKFKKIK